MSIAINCYTNMESGIDEGVEEVTRVNDYGYPNIEIGNRDYYVFQDRDSAGQAARDYWKDMAENDPQEFTCIVGEEALIAWALGQNYAPGTIGVNSLEEWLDLYLDVPEEQWGSYDGCEIEGTISKALMEELGFDDKNVVFYRHN